MKADKYVLEQYIHFNAQFTLRSFYAKHLRGAFNNFPDFFHYGHFY